MESLPWDVKSGGDKTEYASSNSPAGKLGFAGAMHPQRDTGGEGDRGAESTVKSGITGGVMAPGNEMVLPGNRDNRSSLNWGVAKMLDARLAYYLLPGAESPEVSFLCCDFGFVFVAESKNMLTTNTSLCAGAHTPPRI